MLKPSFNDLLAINLIAILSFHKQGMVYDGSKVKYENNTINEEEIIIESIESLNSEEKLTQNYYSRILYSLKDKRLYNVNLENLGLNLKEQSFIYYRLACRNSVTMTGLCPKGKKIKGRKTTRPYTQYQWQALYKIQTLHL